MRPAVWGVAALLLLLGCGPDRARSLAAATWQPEEGYRTAGFALATDGVHLLVGMPGDYQTGAAVLRLSDLSEVGTWRGKDGTFMGYGLAAGDPDRDGVTDFAVGAHGEMTADPENGGYLGGAAYLLRGPPAPRADGRAAPIARDASLVFRALPRFSRIGSGCLFAALGPDGQQELVVSGGGMFNGLGTEELYPGGVFAIDPWLRGELTPEDASRSVTEPGAGVAVRMAAWDGDGDGIDDLVTTDIGQVNRFASPWVGHIAADDAATIWTAGVDEVMGGEDDLGELALVDLGDVTGDGLPDLAMGAHTHGQREGALYVARGGELDSKPASELSIRVEGSDVGEGVGTAAAAGDIDGDGERDLVVGAGGVYPGDGPGKVLVFPGPLQGRLRQDDAWKVISGDHPFDAFGWSVLAVDVDRDGRDDLVVGATGMDEGTGGVYLLPAHTL